MALQALRQQVGSRHFLAILQRWVTLGRHRPVSTADFIALSERVSGQDLEELFDAWLFVAKRPARL